MCISVNICMCKFSCHLKKIMTSISGVQCEISLKAPLDKPQKYLKMEWCVSSKDFS